MKQETFQPAAMHFFLMLFRFSSKNLFTFSLLVSLIIKIIAKF